MRRAAGALVWMIGVVYDPFTAGFPCRRIGRLNPYEPCLELRSDESTSTVKLRLAYHNGRDRVVY
jgi:hypothetical protein